MANKVSKTAAPITLAHPAATRRAVRHLKRVDPIMGRLITEVGACGFRLRSDGAHFDHITRAIVYQQLSGKAAATIHARVQALLWRPSAHPGGAGRDAHRPPPARRPLAAEARLPQGPRAACGRGTACPWRRSRHCRTRP